MKLYTKIINEETKECLIINQEIAKQQRLQDMEVEFGYNGKAYLKGYAPQKPKELIDQEKIAEYQKYLADTDYVVVKISEAMVSGSKQLINELKNKYADVLNERDKARKQINELEKEIKDKKEETIEQIQEKDTISIEEIDKISENIDGYQVKVADSIEIIPEQTEKQNEEKQDEVIETMDSVENIRNQ